MTCKRSQILFLLQFMAASVYCMPLHAQISNGTIRGTVTDTSGAVLPQAAVGLTKVETGEHYTTQSNKEGYYTFTALSPGAYAVEISAPGFAMWDGRLRLLVAQEAVINASLKPGSVNSTVTVSDVTPVIDAGDGTISDVKGATRIETLPLQNSNFLNILNFSPGVVAGSYAGQGNGYTRVNGIPGGSITFQVDGQYSNDRYTNDLQSTPQALQTIQELKVTTSSGSAEYGSPGVVDVVTKSGTNVFHGQIHELYQGGAFEAKSFEQTTSTPHLVHNEFGGDVGGPVWIPKLYDGRNKTFFFFDVEKLIQHSFAADQEFVPQTNWLQGDFSDYLDVNGNPITIYDPATSVLNPATGTYTRQPFPNNKIPANRFNSISAKVASYLPAPNINTTNGKIDTDQLQYGVDWQNPAAINQIATLRYTGKVDQNIGKNLFSARYTYTNQAQLTPYVGTLLNPQLRSGGGHNGTLSFTSPIGSHLVNEARVGVQIYNQFAGPLPVPGLVQSLGLPVYPNALAWPGIYFDDQFQYSLTGIDRQNPKSQPNQDISAANNVSLSRGRHEMKFGGQVANYRVNTVETGQPGGNYNFSGDFTAQEDPANPTFAANDTGAGLADMLLGLVDGSFLNLYPTFHTRQTDYDGFAQDNWKLRPNLTLNLGVRYEYWSPFTDAGGLSADLNVTGQASGGCTVPGYATPSGNAQPCVTAGTAGYPSWFAQSIPAVVIPDTGKGQDPNLITTSQQAGIPLQRASAAGLPSTLWNMPKNNWAPRLGFAYQAAPRTVLRGGYGFYYWVMPLVQYHQTTRTNVPWTTTVSSFLDPNDNACGQEYGGAPIPCASELSFNSNPGMNPAAASRNFGNSFINTSNNAVSYNGGWNTAAWDPNYKAQRAQEWNAQVEQAFASNWAFALSYIGNHGDHQLDTDPVNALLPRSYVPAGPNQSSNAARRMYPIYETGNTNGGDLLVYGGFSNHHELRAEMNHVVAGSFTFQSYFTWAKTLTTAEGGLNSLQSLSAFPAVATNNAPLSERLRDIYAPDSYLPSKTFGLNGHYELPLGRGKQFFSNSNAFVSRLIDGWNTSVFFLWRSGLPFGPYYSGGNGSQYEFAPGVLSMGALPKDKRTSTQWFNASVWDPTKGAYNGQTYELRDSASDTANFTSDLPNGIPRNYLTGPGFWNADGTAYKLTPLTERVTLDMELQVFNIFNHISLGLPSNAGVITSGVGQSRLLQLQGKIIF